MTKLSPKILTAALLLGACDASAPTDESPPTTNDVDTEAETLGVALPPPKFETDEEHAARLGRVIPEPPERLALATSSSKSIKGRYTDPVPDGSYGFDDTHPFIFLDNGKPPKLPHSPKPPKKPMSNRRCLIGFDDPGAYWKIPNTNTSDKTPFPTAVFGWSSFIYTNNTGRDGVFYPGIYNSDNDCPALGEVVIFPSFYSHAHLSFTNLTSENACVVFQVYNGDRVFFPGRKDSKGICQLMDPINEPRNYTGHDYKEVSEFHIGGDGGHWAPLSFTTIGGYAHIYFHRVGGGWQGYDGLPPGKHDVSKTFPVVQYNRMELGTTDKNGDFPQSTVTPAGLDTFIIKY